MKIKIHISKLFPQINHFIFSYREKAFLTGNDRHFWLNGIAVFTPKIQVSESFLHAFLNMDDRMVDLTREASPVADVYHPGYYHAAYDEYANFEKSICTSYSLAPQGIIFDSVVSSVKGYCEAKRRRCDNHVGICNISNTDIFKAIGQQSITEITQNSTQSSNLSFDHSIWNIQHIDDDKRLPIEYILSHKAFERAWVQIKSFIYSDGSVYPPKDLRLVTAVPYHLPSQIKLMINVISGFGIIFCAFSSWLIQKNCNHHIFQAYGPVFHHMLCVGVSLVFLGCVVSNIDDSYGYAQTFLDFSCYLRVICRSCGYLSVCIVYMMKV